MYPPATEAIKRRGRRRPSYFLMTKNDATANWIQQKFSLGLNAVCINVCTGSQTRRPRCTNGEVEVIAKLMYYVCSR